MGTIQPIATLKKQYEGEWLAILVREEGPSGPEAGELLYHSKDVSEVWWEIRGDNRKIYVTYAGPLFKEGWAAAYKWS